jgi:adenylate cyclase
LETRYTALGVPFDRGFDDDDVAAARRLATLLTVLDRESVERVVRADAYNLARVALTHLDVAREQIVEPLRERGLDDAELALRLAEAQRALQPVAADLVRDTYLQALHELLSTRLVADVAQGRQLQAAVGFADVVGYTSLSARIDPSGLEDVVDAFEARVFAATSEHPDVRVVKFIGDAVMLLADEPAPLAEGLLTLVSPAEPGDALRAAPIRGGMAFGQVITRVGDLYGDTVNLAARLTDRARPGQVLAAGDLADELTAVGLEVVPLEAMELRGIGSHRPVALRPHRA